MVIDEVETSAGTLAVRASPGPGDPLVCLHGFTLHGGMFATLADWWRGGLVLAPDLPGHGRTTVAPVTLEATLTALCEWLEPLAPALTLGYSQGGRLALHLAAHRPDLTDRMIVVSAGAGLDEAERRKRRPLDEQLAARIERDGVGPFLDRWLADPVMGTSRLDRDARTADRALRQENTAAGLAAALRGLGQGVLPAVAMERVRSPVLWVAGGLDEKYTSIAETGATRPGDALAVVPGVGHNVVLEAPAALAGAVDAWISHR